MTLDELRELVRRGEGQRTEFKAADADAAAIARAIVALANSGGGLILVGVGDDGEFLGLWYTQPPHLRRHVRTMPNLSNWQQWMVNVSGTQLRSSGIGHPLVASAGRKGDRGRIRMVTKAPPRRSSQ